jgi:F0F1-type ATP synthase delta subunit
MALEHKEKAKSSAARRLELPTVIFGPVEINRLLRELETLEDFLRQSNIREPGKQPALPKTSRTLEAIAGNNNLNLLTANDLKKLQQFLVSVKAKAPVIHMSLAADPSAVFTAKIVAWLRTNVHPYALLQLGLQPTLAAGCILRTPNKTFDFSLRNQFLAQRSLLLSAIDAKTSTPVLVAVPAEAAHE